MNQKYYQPVAPVVGGFVGVLSSVIPPFRRVSEQYSELFTQYSEFVQQQEKLEKMLQQLKKEQAALSDDYTALNNGKKSLQQKVAALQHNLKVMEQEKHKLKTKLSGAQSALAEAEQTCWTEAIRATTAETELANLHCSYQLMEEKLQKALQNLNEKHSALGVVNQALNNEKLSLQQEITALQHNLETLNQGKQKLKAELSVTQGALVEAEQACLVEADRAETAEAALFELKSRYHLVSSAITAEVVQSPRYLKFSELLTNTFLPFANQVNVLANEAEMIIRLKAVEDQVRLVESLARFKNKTVVAVSGGFSSGKSSFISSLFSDENIQLPIGVQPITAIPTYVFHSEKNQIVGYSARGGEVKIPADIYAQLSHEFVQNFGFNLRDLLPFIALETPIEQYKNLSFIDLPGYNPGDREGFTGHDESSASEYMAQAQCILWVIGLDANGTISRADIDFLLDHAPAGVRLYVILNKADLKPLSDVQEVMQEVAEMLFMDGVEFEGISAYSSEWQEELAFEQLSLHDILSEWNQPKDTYHVLVEEVDQIFIEYKQAFLADIQNRKEKTALLKALELDLHELGAFDEQVNAEPFDLSTYRRSSGAEQEEQTEATQNQLEQKTAQPDPKEQRLDKIMLIKQYLSDLRLDYAVKQRESELDELVNIWRSFHDILTSGSLQQREHQGDDAEHVISEPQGKTMKHGLSEKKSELTKLMAVLSQRTYG